MAIQRSIEVLAAFLQEWLAAAIRTCRVLVPIGGFMPCRVRLHESFKVTGPFMGETC